METKPYDNNQIKTIKQIPIQKWENLAQKKIFFGHQSVGNNILLGINEVKSTNDQIRLNIILIYAKF